MSAQKFVVVSVTEDNDLRTTVFDSYEEALEYIDCSEFKCVLVGPEVLEEHT